MPDIETFPDTTQHPDNVDFGTDMISWDTQSTDGWPAVYGVIQPDFEGIVQAPDTGERIWLYDPTGEETLKITVNDEEGKVISTHELSGEGSLVYITGGHKVTFNSPKGQGDIAYIHDYPDLELPARKPSPNQRVLTIADYERVWGSRGAPAKAPWNTLVRYANQYPDFPLRKKVAEDGTVSFEGNIEATRDWIDKHGRTLSWTILGYLLAESED